MKLYCSDTSPYSRKVRITALEKGLDIELIAANPFEDNAELVTANPLGAVPTFLTETGEALFDSPVICAYLNSLKPEPDLIPHSHKWAILRYEALCDGILDAAFSLVMEGRRDEGEQSPYWIDRWSNAIGRSVGFIENDLAPFEGDLTLAQIALGSALGYLDFRLDHLNWRKGRPKMETWFAMFSERQSMVDTVPG